MFHYVWWSFQKQQAVQQHLLLLLHGLICVSGQPTRRKGKCGHRGTENLIIVLQPVPFCCSAKIKGKIPAPAVPLKEILRTRADCWFSFFFVVPWDSRDWHWNCLPIIRIIIMVITAFTCWWLLQVRHLAAHGSSLINSLPCRVDVTFTCDSRRFRNASKVTRLLKVNTEWKLRWLYW